MVSHTLVRANGEQRRTGVTVSRAWARPWRECGNNYQHCSTGATG